MHAVNRTAFLGRTPWCGKRCMRVSVCNGHTCQADIDRSVEAVRDAILPVRSTAPASSV